MPTHAGSGISAKRNSGDVESKSPGDKAEELRDGQGAGEEAKRERNKGAKTQGNGERMLKGETEASEV